MGDRPHRPRRRRLVRALVLAGVALPLVLVVVSVSWTRVASSGHRHAFAAAPVAPVVIVPGARIRDGRPMPFLQGRLDVAVALVAQGKVQRVLVSGDAAGDSGDEIAAMTAYLTGAGVDPDIVTADPYGLDTYDTCARAASVYGVDRALIATQAYHVPRAVALCRAQGIDADGVAARCPGCRQQTLVRNEVREWLATVEALRDAIEDRDPVVTT